MERSREEVAALRARVRQEAADIGIDEAFIALLVDTFYARIREDAVLGPIFAARIDDWPHHLGRMRAFWSSVLLHSGSFSGNPMLRHVAIPEIGRDEFVRWLALFEATLGDVASHQQASAAVIAKARSIAESLYTGIQMHRDGVRDPSQLKKLEQAA